MGISKAMMEKVMISKARSTKNTIICATRYGNVMASRGSVIPLFCNQIISGKPITITNPFMTRFMMNLNNAIDLVFLLLIMHLQEIFLFRKLLLLQLKPSQIPF